VILSGFVLLDISHVWRGVVFVRSEPGQPEDRGRRQSTLQFPSVCDRIIPRKPSLPLPTMTSIQTPRPHHIGRLLTAVALLIASGLGGEGCAAGPEGDTTCGPGTVLSAGQCVVATTCGPGTVEVSGKCVPGAQGGTGGGSGQGGAPGEAGGANIAGNAGQSGTVEGGAAGVSAMIGGGGVGSAGASGGNSSAGAGGSNASPDACENAVDVTDILLAGGKYAGTAPGTGTLSGICDPSGAGEVVLKLHLDQPMRLSLLLTTEDGPSPLDGAIYLRSSCTTASSEIACRKTADFATGPLTKIVPAGDVFVVVDGGHAAGSPFELELHGTPVCLADEDCPSESPRCNPFTHSCATCVTGFDCSSPDAPACLATGLCGTQYCKKAPANNGPSVATPLVLGEQLIEQYACAYQQRWYSFTLDKIGAVVIDVTSVLQSWYMYAFDSEGHVLGGFYMFAEDLPLELWKLSAGTYYVAIWDTANGNNPFKIQVNAKDESPCKKDADCLLFANFQFMRASCDVDTGACSSLQGGGLLTDGAVCDSDDDCASGSCTYFPYQRGPLGHSYCTKPCAQDSECNAEQVCDRWVHGTYECLPRCETDANCPPNLPSATGFFGPNIPHFACDVNSGRCSGP
jgi:hypothetical protein